MNYPEGWNLNSVERLCEIVTSGGTPSRSNPEYFRDGTIPWVKTGELQDAYIEQTEEAITPGALSASSAKLLPVDTVLMAMYGATVGALGILRKPSTCNQASCAMVAAPDRCDARWLFYALLNDRDRIVSLATGAAQQNLSGKTIRQFTYATPSVQEQRAIAEVLGALDDKIAANARLTESIDRLLDARFEGATRGAPQGMLEEIAEVNGITVTPGQGQIRYIDIASVGVGSYEYPALTDWSSAPGRARRKVSEGDTVWSTVRPNRRSHALVLDAGRNIVASTGLAVITPREEDFAFVYESTRTSQFTTFLESIAEGSAYPAVKAPRFAEAPVPLPSVEQRRAFEALAAPLRRRGHAAAMESRSLARTRDELLPLLMSGKVRVKDAEKIVEGSL